MADALVAPPVAISAGVISAFMIALSSQKVSKSGRNDIVPMMGVLGAFVFAAQMINFSIPGTGSSGHIIGGILLASMLGPWAAYITLSSVLIIQCLVFADGGLMALGCNLLNMGVMSCLVGYPFIYRPIAGKSLSRGRIMTASIAGCIIALELGALLVTAETTISGITELPARDFLLLMIPIHFVIGLCEGIATGAIICFVSAYKPDMLYSRSIETQEEKRRMPKKTIVLLSVFAIAALFMAVTFTFIASDNPDGLEWSILNLTGATEIGDSMTPPTAVMPDYDSSFSGIVGGAIVVITVWAVSALIFRKRRKECIN